jgi:exopolysaccharide biosynthesis polyprenyl glycosylphosphotransferase
MNGAGGQPGTATSDLVKQSSPADALGSFARGDRSRGGLAGETVEPVSDGIVKKNTYAAASGAANLDAGLALGEVEVGRSRGVGGRRALVTLAGDGVALSLASVLAFVLLPLTAHMPLVERSLGDYAQVRPPLLVMLFMVPWTIFVLYGYGLYRSSARSINGWVFSEGLRGLTAISVAAWSALVLTLVLNGTTDSLGYIAVLWCCEVVAVPLCRATARAAVWQSPRLSERTLIVGAGAVGHLLGEKIGKHPEYNLRLVGYLDDGEPFGPSKLPVPVIGRLEDLNDVLDTQRVTRVIIAFSRARHQQILDVVRTCADRGVRVNIVPRLFEILSSQTEMDDVEGIPLLDVAHVEMSRFNMVVKRAFDLVVGGALTLLLLPLIGVLAVAIKLDSRGPVFFRQDRMGRGGRVFRMIKLRSMHVNAEELRQDLADLNEYSGPMFKMKSDPRVTRVGRFIRKYSLDEVPQILNVVRGEMSLVGPRPLWVDEAARCRGWTKKRLDITPGMTGLWQVTGRNDVPFDEMVKLDYMYVTGWTLSWDIKILLETIPAVLGKRGAY